MRIKNHTVGAFFVFFAFSTGSSYAAVGPANDGTAIRPVSQYGLIQNVQNYSNNPFWTPLSPYNQKFPQPVYVKGPQVGTAACQQTVNTLIVTYCSMNNNCRGLSLSDVRPAIMLELSHMTGHNYASSCYGFIDSEFDEYMARYSVATLPGTRVDFPSGTVANPNYDENDFQLDNPYERQDGTWNGEEWQKERKERIKELEKLQAMNGVGSESLEKTDFPTTFADLSFEERLGYKTEGYEPYDGMNAYQRLKLDWDDDKDNSGNGKDDDVIVITLGYGY